MFEIILYLIIFCLSSFVAYLTYRIFFLQKKLIESERKVETTSKTLIQKHIEQLDSNERLQKLLQTKTDFVSIASHQLRSPLTDVKWGLSFFLDRHRDLVPEDRDHVNQILVNVDRMNHLINELLDFVASEAGTSEQKKDLVNVELVVRRVIKEANNHFREKTVTVHPTYNYGPEPVLIDVGLIEIAFTNLIHNAFHYTPDNKNVYILTEQRGKQFYFEVRDEGVGVPKNKQRHIFSRFKRSPDAIKMNSLGIGLGLHITKNIVDNLGGRIGFVSAGEGEGATFYFYIPVERPTTAG